MPLAPIDRIRQALKDPERVAAFDRALAEYANRVERIVEGNESAAPSFGQRFNAGKFIEAHVDPDLRFHA